MEAMRTLRKIAGITSISSWVLAWAFIFLSAIFLFAANRAYGFASHIGNIPAGPLGSMATVFIIGYILWKFSKPDHKHGDWPIYLLNGLIFFVIGIVALVAVFYFISLALNSAASGMFTLATYMRDDLYPLIKLIATIISFFWMLILSITIYIAHRQNDHKRVALLCIELTKEAIQESLEFFWELFTKSSK